MNKVDYWITEEYIGVSGTIRDEGGNTTDTIEIKIEVKLHIFIRHKTTYETADAYNFDAIQRLDFFFQRKIAIYGLSFCEGAVLAVKVMGILSRWPYHRSGM